MVLFRKHPTLLRIGSVLVILLGVAVALFHFYLAPRLARKGLKEMMESAFEGQVAVKRAEIHWLSGPAIEYRDVSIRKTGQGEDWLHIDRVLLIPRLSSLLSSSFRWRVVDLDGPVLRLADGGARLSQGSWTGILDRFDDIRVRKGRVQWAERGVNEVFLSLERPSPEGISPFVVRGVMIKEDTTAGQISVHGRFHRVFSSHDGPGFDLTARVEAEAVDPSWFGGEFPRSLASRGIDRLTVQADLQGDPMGRFQCQGILSLTDGRLEGMAEGLGAEFTITGDGEVLELLTLRFKGLPIPLEGKGSIRGGMRADSVVFFEVNSPWVSIRNWEWILEFLPDRIRSVWKPIEGGEVVLVSLGFTGPLQKLRPPSDEESLSHWRGDVRFRDLTFQHQGEPVKVKEGSARLSRGAVVAEAHGLSVGGSELQDLELSLSRLFEDRALDVTIRGIARLGDLDRWVSTGLAPCPWVDGISPIKSISGRGKVDLKIEKSLGSPEVPVIRGRLVIQDGTVETTYVPGVFRRVNGALDISPGKLLVRNLVGNWRSSTVKVAGSISGLFSDPAQLDLSITGELDLADLGALGSSEVVPAAARPTLREIGSPAGRADYALTIKGSPGESDGVNISGELSVRKGSFRLWNAYPMAGVTGRIVFSEEKISVSELKGSWKNSSLQLKLRLERRGKAYARDLNVLGAFDLEDIASEGFDQGWPRLLKKILRPFEFQRGRALLDVTDRKAEGSETVEGIIHFDGAAVRYLPVFPPLLDLKGTVSFDEQNIKDLDLLGRYGSGLVRIQGNVASQPGKPIAHLSIGLEAFDWEDLFSWPWHQGVSPGEKATPPVLVDLRVNEGLFREIPISNVEARLRIDRNTVAVEKFGFEAAGGSGSITGQLSLGEDQQLAFECRPYLFDLDAHPVLMSFQREGSKRQLTGLGSAAGVIRGRGRNLAEIATSLSGEAEVRLENGRVAQFTVLSRVFSLLDMAWLLRGDFPDLKTEGLAYKAISGHVAFDQGKASTDDLLLEGDSMRITAVGSLDIPTGGLNAKLGIGRIGVGGRVVSKIPIFGEIFTTHGGSFVNYYVAVQGTIAEPQVQGIPLESAQEGILGPIRRLLEKPAEWFSVPREADPDRHLEKRANP